LYNVVNIVTIQVSGTIKPLYDESDFGVSVPASAIQIAQLGEHPASDNRSKLDVGVMDLSDAETIEMTKKILTEFKQMVKEQEEKGIMVSRYPTVSFHKHNSSS
jgi:hypothetical protein